MAAATIHILSLPKSGHAPHENEDAAFVRSDHWPVHAAIADGATESAFSRHWARILVQNACTTSTLVPTLSSLDAWRAEWRQEIAPQINEQPWYVAAKAQEGAHATYLHCIAQQNGTYQAAACGDSVLLHLRNNALHTAWPTSDPDAFGHRPALVSTTNGAAPSFDTYTSTWQPNDAIVLATDAAAAWLLRTNPARALTWTASTFATEADEARSTNRLANDDTTVAVIQFEA